MLAQRPFCVASPRRRPDWIRVRSETQCAGSKQSRNSTRREAGRHRYGCGIRRVWKATAGGNRSNRRPAGGARASDRLPADLPYRGGTGFPHHHRTQREEWLADALTNTDVKSSVHVAAKSFNIEDRDLISGNIDHALIAQHPERRLSLKSPMGDRGSAPVALDRARRSWNSPTAKSPASHCDDRCGQQRNPLDSVLQYGRTVPAAEMPEQASALRTDCLEVAGPRAWWTTLRGEFDASAGGLPLGGHPGRCRRAGAGYPCRG